MVHVKPHRWADAQAGRLSAAAVRDLEAHAATCAACAGARDRVHGAIAAFSELRDAEPPALGWDHIGARIYWVTSSERRARQNSAHRRWPLVLVPASLVAAAAAIWLLFGHTGSPPERVASPPAPERATDPSGAMDSPPIPRPVDVAAPAVALRGVVTLLQGDVTHGGERLRFDEPIEQGSELITGQGRVAVQFQKGSGFVLDEHSSLTMVQFDARHVAIRVNGEVLVDISRRDPEQTFVVLAGDREVSVRGTIFRVSHREGALRVACSHGKVMVADDHGKIDVSAGQELWFEGGEVIRESALALADVDFMKHAVPSVKAWVDADAMLQTSATLAVSAADHSTVTIDGIARGVGEFRLRVMPGRHHVAGDGTDGTWFELDAGDTVSAPVRAPARARPASSSAASRRRRQFLRALRPGAHTCMQPVRKQGMADGAFIVLDVGIHATGAITHANIVDSNLPLLTERCIRDAIDGISLPAGSPASVEQRIEL